MSNDPNPAEEAGTAHPGRTPPYVSFQTFLSLIEDLKTHGLAPRIDRSVLKRFSGGVGSQLLAAIRMLALVTSKDEPTPALKALVDTYGTDGFKTEMRKVIEVSYPFLDGLDLTSATPSMFAEAFRNGTNAKEDVLRKCRTFYLHAARYCGIPLGSRLEPNTARRGRPPGGGVRRRTRTKLHDAAAENAMSAAAPLHHTSSYEDRLLDKFPAFDPAWPDNLKQSWFDGFKQFQEMSRKDR